MVTIISLAELNIMNFQRIETDTPKDAEHLKHFR